MLEDVYGFDEVHRLFDADASQAAIRQWLFDTARQAIGANDRLIFFFAGHGTSLKSSGHPYGYLIPQDAREGAYSSYLDMEELKRSCGLIAAKHILLILDCCFSGIAAVTARATRPTRPKIVDDAYLQSITKRRAWQVLTAGASDELAADSSSRPGHSAFTSALLEALQEGRADRNRDGIITAWDVATYIKPEVSRATARCRSAGQTPFFNYIAGSEQGDFVFVLPAEPVEPIVEPPQPRKESISPIVLDWVTVPAGEFLMGSDKATDDAARDDEMPQHTLYLPEYRISKYPITNAQYRTFTKATHYQTPSDWEYGGIPHGMQDHPVTFVLWQDAVAFCQWAGMRLPTEAEWEKAARGTDGRIWPWGNSKPTAQHCNFAGQVGDTTPVGHYPDGASPYGVLDMAGNVWEWTSSKYKPYPYDPQDGREDAEGDDSRTLRGGSWLNSFQGRDK